MRLLAKIFGQSLGILALSAALALGVNALRPDGLPLAQATQSAVQLDKASGEIGIKDAAVLFITGRAVFLDARSQYEFEQGHIQGALSLPPREFASQFQDLKPKLAGKEAVITYCDGDRCPLSHALAEHLRNAGVKNVFVLKNGWTLWQAEKLPTVAGAAAAQSQPVVTTSGAVKLSTKASSAAQSQPKGSKTGSQGSAGGICRDCENK